MPAALQIIGVNEVGHESGNASICNGRDLPWLQEDASQSVWNDWQVTYRDVIVLDAANQPQTIYNLSDNNLTNQTNYDELKNLLRQAVQSAANP